jgi:hypothetical protein
LRVLEWKPESSRRLEEDAMWVAHGLVISIVFALFLSMVSCRPRVR